ncbi:TadE-like protein [Novipirellula galeiformis]|uniref:TadE-like protein n=1 Tax=Novipirellula galeiformis TaxID=2528004 RepID=A0A5C6BZT6_9BACT|nr:TadE family protein [Novipirellula galeiformis]TWU17445.1 TadE-like protein [Novipirellula galeiformis]
MSNNHDPHSQRRRRGCTTVEAAVVAPVFLLTALVTVDFCRIYHAETIVCQAVHAAAVHGAGRNFYAETREQWEAEVREVVDRELEPLGPQGTDNVHVSVTAQQENELYFLATVEVAFPFQPIIASNFLPLEMLINRRQIIRRYR